MLKRVSMIIHLRLRHKEALSLHSRHCLHRMNYDFYRKVGKQKEQRVNCFRNNCTETSGSEMRLVLCSILCHVMFSEVYFAAISLHTCICSEIMLKLHAIICSAKSSYISSNIIGPFVSCKVQNAK